MAISLAKVLRFFSRSSSLERRVSKASWILHSISVDISSPRGPSKSNVPKTGVFGRDEAAAHSHYCKQTNLTKIGTFSWVKLDRLTQRKLARHTRHTLRMSVKEIEHSKRNVMLTSALVQFERKTSHHSRHRLKQESRRIERFLE